MFDPELEARVVAAVRTVLATPNDDGAATHQLCEAASALLEAFLQLSDDWPESRFIDGLMPLSLQGADSQLELAAAAIVTDAEQEDAWVVEPLLAHFSLEGESLADVSLLFAYANREPPRFDPEQTDFTLELPVDPDGFLYRLSTAEQDPEAN
jgi:hypothetical protein